MKKLIGISIIRNEEYNYLKPWLKNMSKFLDYHIFLDDASDDNTPKIIQNAIDNGYAGEIHYRTTSLFKDNEPKLRSELWEYTRKVAKEGDWILIVDGDEFYDNDLMELKKNIFKTQAQYGLYYIGLYDMWNEHEYRIDGYWSPPIIKNRLFRFLNKPFGLYDAKLHQAPCPTYVLNMAGKYSNVYFIHKSYISDKAKKNKYDFYKKNVETGNKNYTHALSIMEKKAITKKYKERNIKNAPEILICSLIHNRAWMLDLFLSELYNIDYPKDKLSYYFIVNNITDESLTILKKWEHKFKKIKIEIYNFNKSDFVSTDHKWDIPLIKEMANMRNMHLVQAQRQNVDFVLSIDSDLLAPPCILKHLIQQEKDIISPVFYAGWGENDAYGPQVWSRGGAEIDVEFSENIIVPNNTFRVGGLGAFTLISKRVWESGVNYTRVYNLPSKMFGEDRDFCTRASVMGFELWANNTYPIIHIDNAMLLEKYYDDKIIEIHKKEYFVFYDNYKYIMQKLKRWKKILISFIPIKKWRRKLRNKYK